MQGRVREVEYDITVNPAMIQTSEYKLLHNKVTDDWPIWGKTLIQHTHTHTQTHTDIHTSTHTHTGCIHKHSLGDRGC